MARWPRLILPDVPIHLVQRGNNRTPTFRCIDDLSRYREIVHDAGRRTRCQVHAYVLMTNHVHLLLTPEDVAGPARFVQIVGRRYVRYFNRRHDRSGTLWEGRYKSSLIDSDNYLLACSRYIDRNPVRAGLTDDPAEYRWSSFRHLALGMPDELVTPHPVYRALGATPALRRDAYRVLCEGEVAPPTLEVIRTRTAGGSAMGDTTFRVRIRAATQRRVLRLPHGGDRRSSSFDLSMQCEQ